MSDTVQPNLVEIDEAEAAENAVADLIGFRTNPQKGSYLAISMVRSLYREETLTVASLANGEKTREQLEVLSIGDVGQAIEFIAFSCGYLTARMFWPTLGEGAVLPRILMPDSEAIPDALRRESVERANQYLPCLSEIHDNRATPRNSRLVHRLLTSYLAVLIEDPRQSTLDTLLRGFEEEEVRHSHTGFSARQVAEALDRSRLWATLGWRRGQAERRFRIGPRAAYLENIAGDVRIIFNRDAVHGIFADVRRLRYVTLDTLRDKPHSCDDAVIAAWMADNCALARQLWTKPAE